MTAVLTREVHVVVPSGVDDPRSPSGGNLYDRRVCAGLTATGWAVHESAVDGGWPRPDATARAALAAALATPPDGAAVLIDGLVACGVPEVVVPAARRLALVVLLHLPLGDEWGAPAELVAREREVLAAATAVVATSPWAARRAVALHGLDPERVTVAAPGVDPAPRAPGGDGTNLLCVGALTPTKGQDLLVDALARLTNLPWTCTLVGPLRDPAYAAAIRAASDRVRLTGPLAGAALDAAYAAADLLVVPSRAETYGMVVTEALARGIPVLASDAGGLPSTLGRDPDDRVPGAVVQSGDVEALTAALRGWLTDPGQRAELRRRAIGRASMLHGWEVTARCLTQTLGAVTRTTSGPA